MNGRSEPSAKLSDGVHIPLLGFGTWQIRGESAYRSVRAALDVGYRHVDTATMYGNETQVGRALRDSGVPREEVFVTTKLPREHAGRERATIEQSLRDLGLEDVDLWLVHWPPGGQARPETWEQFLAVRDDGLARAVGVSNYSVTQIDELVSATGEAPALNQIRWSPALYDPRVVEGHRERGVVLEGYSPLRATDLDHPTLKDVAQELGVTTAQVVVRWHLEHEVVVIPKSERRERIASNFDVFGFRLSEEQVARIDRMGR